MLSLEIYGFGIRRVMDIILIARNVTGASWCHMSTTKSGLFVVRFFQKVADTGMIYCSNGTTAVFKVTARGIQCSFGG